MAQTKQSRLLNKKRPRPQAEIRPTTAQVPSSNVVASGPTQSRVDVSSLLEKEAAYRQFVRIKEMILELQRRQDILAADQEEIKKT